MLGGRKKTFGCAFVFFPMFLLALGLALFWAGRQLTPRSQAAADVFRSDPSCAADVAARVSQGACTTVAATVLLAEMRSSPGGKAPVRTPLVHLRYADGTFHSAELDGSAADVFVYSVRPGAAARAQLFRGELVRVTSGTISAETISAPDVDLETARELPWVGTVAIVVGLLMVIARWYVVRRSA